MTKPDELFPFPPFPPEKKEEGPAGDSRNPLNPSEIQDLRAVLELFRAGKLSPLPVQPSAPAPAKGDIDPFAEPPPVKIPSVPKDPVPTIAEMTSSAEKEVRTVLLRFLDSRAISAPWEMETRNSLKAVLEHLKDQYQFVQAVGAIAGVFPICDYLRHGTPEQKLFALISLGDRFLQVISGLRSPQRKDLIKIIGSYLSESSVHYSFLSMEGEPFNFQFHERVDGSSSSGRVISEMRGFVVTRKNSDQLVRLGRVLT
jgi:hypothetical protein